MALSGEIHHVIRTHLTVQRIHPRKVSDIGFAKFNLIRDWGQVRQI